MRIYVARILQALLVVIGVGLLFCEIASLFLPETSDISIIAKKLGHLALTGILGASTIELTLQNAKLRQQLQAKK